MTNFLLLPRFTRVEAVLFWMSAAWLLLALLWSLGIEFESWWVQSVAVATLGFAPIVMVVLSSRIRRLGLRVGAMVATSLLSVLMLLPASCAVLERNDPPGQELFRTKALGDDIVLYRFGCGAMCDDAVVLKQERRLIPGIRAKRVLASWTPAEEGTVTMLSRNRLRVDVEPYLDRSPKISKEFELRHRAILP